MSRQLDDLYEIENTVDRAAAIVRRMARKIATDKYVTLDHSIHSFMTVM
jgi:hypothetical protein